jgi:hypothetical protein
LETVGSERIGGCDANLAGCAELAPAHMNGSKTMRTIRTSGCVFMLDRGVKPAKLGGQAENDAESRLEELE